jgi:hypothetical protein
LEWLFHGNRGRVKVRLAAVAVVGLALAAPTWAQEADQTSTPPEDAQCGPQIEYGTGDEAAQATVNGTFIVTPTEIARTIAPGESVTCQLRLSNRRSERTRFNLRVEGLVGSSSPRRQVEYVERGDARLRNTAAPWVQVQDGSTLRSRQFEVVPVRITVPQDAAPGGHFAAVLVSPATDADDAADTGIGGRVESRIAVPVLITVPGDADAAAEITRASAPGLVWARERWTLRTKVRNSGTVHVQPQGTVEVKGIFGNVVERLPLRGRTILPTASSEANVVWKKPPWFGYYRATITVRNGDDPKRLDSETVTFWALPPWWVLLIIGWLPFDLLITRRILRWRRERKAAEADEDTDLGPDPEDDSEH